LILYLWNKKLINAYHFYPSKEPDVFLHNEIGELRRKFFHLPTVTYDPRIGDSTEADREKIFI
jgi:hypothetical protein